MDKKTLSESDICDKFIRPAMERAGWNGLEQIYREFPLRAGRIEVRGRSARRDPTTVLRADYALFHKPNIPLAVVEAKDNRHAVGAGMAQAIAYAELLDVPFSFSSNGDGFVFRDATRADDGLERTLGLDEFPSPDELWDRYCAWKGWPGEVRRVAGADYAPSKSPRYYQLTAINRTVEAIAAGRKRVLLVMATGTGKTYTAFQIIWRLWKGGAKNRILFLADRNILVDQTMVNDFRQFKGAMAKLSPHGKGVEVIDTSGRKTLEFVDLAIDKATKQVNTSYEIYLGLYQAVVGNARSGAAGDIYKQFTPNFFDLVVVDECHRGSAADDSAWRDILNHFGAAAHIGLTATPKETDEVSNSDYFGEPLVTYSLRQGIDDGYLAPYKVVRVDLDRDAFGWRPTGGMTDRHGHLIEDRVYTGADMNRRLVLERRDAVVAARITDYLKSTSRHDKTIVFCEDIDHAARMRHALAKANADICQKQPNYVVQITGDNLEGKRQLDNFIDPEKTFPVIATTSKLMSTGVDAQTCKLIVLDQNIRSMTLFKQIIGRGTRLREDHGKRWFTILDFKRATELFADPEFDGEPVQIEELRAGDPAETPAEDADPASAAALADAARADAAPFDGPAAPLGPDFDTPDDAAPRRYVVGDAVNVSVARVRVQVLDGDGRLVTESLRDYTRINLARAYDSLDAFLQAWDGAARKAVLIDELERRGVFFEALADELAAGGVTGLDPFDLLLHVAWDRPPLTRRERARRVAQRDVFAQYGPVARRVLEALLDKYADEGLATLESDAVLYLRPFPEIGSPPELVRSFGGRPQYLRAVEALERELYARIEP